MLFSSHFRFSGPISPLHPHHSWQHISLQPPHQHQPLPHHTGPLTSNHTRSPTSRTLFNIFKPLEWRFSLGMQRWRVMSWRLQQVSTPLISHFSSTHLLFLPPRNSLGYFPSEDFVVWRVNLISQSAGMPKVRFFTIPSSSPLTSSSRAPTRVVRGSNDSGVSPLSNAELAGELGGLGGWL